MAMNRTQEQEQQWRQLNEELNAWFEKLELSAPAQIAFQRTNSAFAYWIDNELVPSLMHGEYAANRCLQSIVNEPNETLRYTKFLAAFSVWESLDAPANSVAADLHAQGWTEERLSAHLKYNMIEDYSDTNNFDPSAPQYLH